ncbi:MAG: cobaltochelatase subunit CobN [Bacteroidales bacterium]|nr:cobaltochelatase subunit CobN [Bacteroidales bacterium]
MKKRLILIALSVIGLVVICWVYTSFLSRTRIAFINYQPSQLGEIAHANNTWFIDIRELSPQNIDEVAKNDMVFVNAMGLHITEQQREELQKAAKNGLPILSTAVTNPANDINNLFDDADILKAYLAAGGRHNYHSMLSYVRKYIDGKIIAAEEPDSVIDAPEYDIYHPDIEDASNEELGFNSVADYEQFLKHNNLWNEVAPRIVITGLLGNGADLVSAFERAGDMAYYIPSLRNYIANGRLDSIKPDAIVNMAHGRMGDYVVEYLQKNNIPLFAPLNVNQLADDWEIDKQGMLGGFLSQSVVTPEIDGAIRPYALFANYLNADNIQENHTIRGRADGFVSTVEKHVALKRLANKQKRVAIYYFKGPGQNALTASGLEVIPSLYNFLRHLQSEGYNVAGLPDSPKKLADMIQQRGSVFGTYAEGRQAEFVASGYGQIVNRNEFEKWTDNCLTEQQRTELQAANGDFPGSYLASDNGDLVLPCVVFGNIALMPQLPAGGGDDSFSMVHGTNAAPPYPYVAEYLWAQNAFQANAIVHFGTHGSLEYTPRKQNALGSNDWPVTLIGNLPHVYMYTIGNVGEALIAKRRSYAEIVSYLTAPFCESELTSTYNALNAAIDKYNRLPENASEKQCAALADEVKHITCQLQLDKDLRIESKNYTAADISRIEDFAAELISEKMQGSLYVLGEPYSPADQRSTVVAMAADAIAYSYFNLQVVAGLQNKDFVKKRRAFDAKYLAPAKRYVADVMNGKLSSDKLLNIYGITTADLAIAHKTDSVLKAPARMQAMMMSAAGSSKNASGAAVMMGGQSSSDGAKKGSSMSAAMHAKMKKMARGMSPEEMLAKAKEMGAPPEALEKMRAKITGKSDGGSAMKMSRPKVQLSQSAKDSARAILELEHSIANIDNYTNALIYSTKNELSSASNALNGGYVSPQPGGDPIANQNVLPTGRNMYGINADATPSESAWQTGVELAQATIDSYRAAHNGNYPHKVSYTLWSGEFIETQGATIAQILYMLGVEPIRDFFGRVNDLRLIPSAELGRPRIDVAVQTSGQLRDLAASRLFLINRAVSMAAEANDSSLNSNYVAEGMVEAEKYLTDKGVSPLEARQVARHRVFGAQGGGYGTGIQAMVEKSDAWSSANDIATTYLDNMNAFYGSQDEWEQVNKYAFEAALTHTDAIVQPRQSNTWGALSLDHVYEFMGGMSAAVQHVTGSTPEAYFSDYRNRNHARVQSLTDAIGVESRASLLNPAYIQRRMNGGASSADEIAEMVTNTFGWNALRPEAIDNSLWDRIYDTYVKDQYNLGVRQYFERENPSALQEISAVMLESARKQMWNASREQIAELAKLHTELVNTYNPSCSGFVCDNAKLRDFISNIETDKTQVSDYQQRINAIRSTTTASNDNATILKKESFNAQQQTEINEVSPLFIVVLVVVFVIIVLIIVRRQRRE